jgi:hypothetical protein
MGQGGIPDTPPCRAGNVPTRGVQEALRIAELRREMPLKRRLGPALRGRGGMRETPLRLFFWEGVTYLVVPNHLCLFKTNVLKVL